METQVITIPITTTMDPSQLFDLVLELAERLVDDIESYDEEAEVDEGEVCVSRPPLESKMTTEEYHEELLKYHCRYTQMHPGGSHHETYGIYITAESKEEAELLFRKLQPKALQVWVYEGIQVYAHAEKTMVPIASW